MFEPLEPRLLLDGTGLDSDPIRPPVVVGTTHESGAVELILDLSANATNLELELNADTFAGVGWGSPIPYNNVDILTIILGSGSDHLTINGTSVETRVIGGPGDDRINITEVGSRAMINGGEGHDTLALILNDPASLSASPFTDLAFTVEVLRLEHAEASSVDWRLEDGALYADKLFVVDTLGADALTVVGNGAGDTLTVANKDEGKQTVAIDSETIQIEHGANIFCEGSQGFLTHPSQTFSITMSPDGLNVYSLNGEDGTAMIYDRNADGHLVLRDGVMGPYSEEGKLMVSSRASQQNILFGSSVAIDGEVAVVGARFDGGGSAYILREAGPGNWQKVAKLTASDVASGDYFGYAVAISGDLVVVGALYGDGNVKDSGAAYIFKETSPGIWQQVAKLKNPSGAQYDGFGSSVAIDGDTVIVGEKYGDRSKGSAFIFEEMSGNWEMITKLIASDGGSGDNFGHSVAISGDTVIIGAALDDTEKGFNSGSAYIFQEVSPGKWQQVTKLIASDGAASDFFGWSVGIDGGTAVVGARGDDTINGSNSGSAYIFQEVIPGKWQEVAKLIASDGADGDLFGFSVAIDGKTVIVGAEGDAEGEDLWKGSAYVFQERAPGSWQETTKLTASDGVAYGYFGQSLAVNGRRILVGASGDAYVFSDRTILGIESLAISPEGDYVYAVRPGENAISVFRRNPMTGDLAFIQEVRDALRLRDPGITRLSPDGMLAYVGTASGVSVFSRDKVSGELTFREFIDTDALGRLTSIEVSPDSQFIYLASDAGKLRIYSRAGLDYVQIGVDVDVSYSSILALSPDGENLYVGRKADRTILVFARDPATGTLTLVQEVINGVGGVRGLEGISSLVVTEDCIFVTGEEDNSLVAFTRDEDGRLSFTQRLKNDSGGVQGLEKPNSATISPDGKWIYVGSGGDKKATGGLTWFGILSTPQPASPLMVGYSGIEKLTIQTAGGNDAVSIRSTDVPVMVETGEGADVIHVLGLGQRVAVQIDAGSGDDLIHIGGGNLKEGSGIDLRGGPGEDILLFEPDGNPVTPQVPKAHSGDVKVFGSEFGSVRYESVERIPGFWATVAGPVITPAEIHEGDHLTWVASAMPATNREIISFAWDLNGDGDFGEAIGTDLLFDEDTNTYTATMTLPWTYLREYGLNDGDGPDGTAYEISLRAIDNVGDFAEDTVHLTIKNAAPTLDIKGDASVNEGTPFVLALKAVDPGEDTVTRYTVNWGDGIVESFASAGEVTHTYLDNYEKLLITVDLEDEDGKYENAGSFELQVVNVAPEIISLLVGPPVAAEGGAVTLNCAFSDPGMRDAWNASINWGDGTTTEISGLNADPFESTHTYLHGGIYEITLTLSDDDVGTTVSKANVMVTGAGVVDGVLYVAGTSGNDWVEIDKTRNGKIKVYASFLSDRCHLRTFDAKEIERIEIYLGDGNDYAYIAESMRLPVLMDGGVGNDFLRSGSGPTVMLGGEGNDTLLGGCAGDEIDGGAGHDLIVGNGGNDVIDAGSGNDVVFGFWGDDLILGGDGNDWIFGGSGNDLIHGGDGDDLIFGEGGNDQLYGDNGNDLLVGGLGRHSLDWGTGKDRLIDLSKGYEDHIKHGCMARRKTAICPCASWVKHFISGHSVGRDSCHPNSGIKVTLSLGGDALGKVAPVGRRRG
ncbi:MAG: PKD domain-containing protein [Thermodesulfobacteriota bacterium]